jgi:uncharacterized membrane protein YagU involved in acid resistance
MSSRSGMRTRSIARAWVTAGLVAGVCDLTAACIHAGLLGAPPVRVFHHVASGLIGRDAALAGGAATAALGILMHFVIAFGAAGTYLAMSRLWRFLMDRPLVAGPLYGIAVYWFMQLVVIPLSAINPRPQELSNQLIGIGIHIVCVGLTIALSISRLAPRRDQAAAERRAS